MDDSLANKMNKKEKEKWKLPWGWSLKARQNPTDRENIMVSIVFQENGRLGHDSGMDRTTVSRREN